MTDTSTMEQGEGWWVEKRDGAWQVHYAHRGPGSNICVAQINYWADRPELVAHRFAASSELVDAAKLALATAESWIHDQLDGTGMIDEALAKLEPVRAALLKASGGKDV